MGLPSRRNNKPMLRVSDLREFVYCPRSWAYTAHKVQCKLPPEEIAEVEQRLQEGLEHHREHGEAVCLASRQRRWAASWRYIAIAAAGLAVAVLLVWGR